MVNQKSDCIVFTVKRGITFTRVLRYKTSSGPVDITGCSVVMQIRARPYNGSELLHTVNISITSSTTGEITMTIDASESTNFAWNEGFFDIVITFPDTTNRVLASGRVVVVSAVSV